MKSEMNFEQAINEVEQLIQNTSFEIDYSECDEKDEFVYVVLKIKSIKD
jgi:hypothetical protein